VHHFGDLGGGHYTAHCWNERREKWYYFDDSNVREEVNLKNIVNSSGYILFYKKDQL
jgi:ubiquitin C-terminal hydrolase